MDFSVNQRVRQLLKRKNISQSELSKKLGLKPTSVNLWLKAHPTREVPKEHIIKMREFWPDVDIDFILYGATRKGIVQREVIQIVQDEGIYDYAHNCPKCKELEKKIKDLDYELNYICRHNIILKRPPQRPQKETG